MKCFSVMFAGALLASGCGQASQGHFGLPGDPNHPGSRQQAIEEKAPPVLLDRYELHEIRNGAYVGTALLDKQTGRIWQMSSTSEVLDEKRTPAIDFVKVPIFHYENGKPVFDNEQISSAPVPQGKWNPKTGRYE